MTKRREEEIRYEMKHLGLIAEGIGGEVWHSGGGIFGVLVVDAETESEVFFGFADGVLGWDITDDNGDLIDMDIPESEDLTIEQTASVIDVCRSVIAEAFSKR